MYWRKPQIKVTSKPFEKLHLFSPFHVWKCCSAACSKNGLIQYCSVTFFFFFLSRLYCFTYLKNCLNKYLKWEVIVILTGCSSACMAFVCQKCHCCQDTLREYVKRQQTQRTDYLDYPQACPLHTNKFIGRFSPDFNKNKIGLLVSLRDKLERIPWGIVKFLTPKR